MTKQQLQKELLEKVKEGVKPSTLKKLKRSKSAGDIPTSSPNQEKQITQLQEQVQFHSQTAANYLKSLQTSQAKVSELETTVKERQTHNDALLTKLAESYEELNQLKEPTNLDQHLIARHKSLKDWFAQFKKSQQLDTELQENIEEASTELVKQDNLISSLRSRVIKLKNDKESLQKDLQLASRLAESRKVPYFANENNWDYLKYALYSLVAVGFTVWLVKSFKNIRESPNYE